MRDQLSVTRVKQLHPLIREDVTKFIDEIESTFDITIRIVQGLRTIEEQNALYAQGRTKPGKVVTNAIGGSSYHNYGLSVDLGVLAGNSIDWKYNYKKFRTIYPKYGFTWGADWDGDGKTKDEGDKDEHLVDYPHFQKTFGYNWRQLLDKVKRKDFIPGTKYVNI